MNKMNLTYNGRTPKTPILDGLIESGAITIEDDTYVGHASDGVDVAIGTVYTSSLAETYLTDFPTPDMW